MGYVIKGLPSFLKEAKRLASKYTSFSEELEELMESLEKNPQQGTYIGGGYYKIRMGVVSKGKGKSGGVRVIIKLCPHKVILAKLYDKSEIDNIPLQKLRKEVEPLEQISAEPDLFFPL